MKLAWDAASAAAGALMLLERAGQELDELTSPPRKPVITPRITRLLRVPDLQAMHATPPRARPADPPTHATAPCSCRRAARPKRCADAREPCLTSATSPALLLPDLVTRDELYARLHERLSGAPPRLTDFEREVLFRRAASRRPAQGTPAPFRLRAGLIVEILAFYDELRRRDKTVAEFDRLMTDSLEPSAEIDRGAERLFRQTRFLAAAFDVFERRIAGDRAGRRARPARAAARGGDRHDIQRGSRIGTSS